MYSGVGTPCSLYCTNHTSVNEFEKKSEVNLLVAAEVESRPTGDQPVPMIG